MAATDLENLNASNDADNVVGAVQSFLGSLPEQHRLQSAIDEGRQIAAIVAPLGLPQDLLAAVHVYPLYREKLLSSKSIQNKPLSDISRLIIGLEQLNQFSLPDDWQPGEALAVQQSEALRKMLLAVVSDVRLVLVRIAEQLFRLRQAKTAARETQQALALEAREIYASLANRLGVWQLKWELEDLAFRYLDPDTYLEIARALKEKRTEREGYLDEVQTTLRRELSEQGIEATISGRPKHIYSIWRKMQRKDRGMESLYDIRAVRILVNDIGACYAALGVVHNLWSYIPGEFDDYIANPKENNYQSLHTAVLGPAGKTLEVQIRSHDMHRHAELGVAAHWRYKEGGGAPAAFDQKIQFLRQLLEPTDDGADLLDQIRDDFFEDRVYAVSPKGDVVELPARATPLDFAYHVHTQVGHRCRGAKVNGRIVPLTYHIENGDQVEIITGSQPRPSRDWLSPKLGYLAGARARAKVRNWFRQQDRDQHQRQGREVLDRELARLGVKDMATDRIAKQLKLKDTESLCVALGAGDLTSASIATALQNLRGTEMPGRIRARRPARQKGSQPESVAVSGIGDLMCNFARCCRPVPPEPIVGYITQGRGVSIHRQDCGNFLGLNRRYPERIVEIAWGKQDAGVYPVDLTLHAFDRSGLIRDITSVLADDHANVIDLKSHTDKKSMQVVMAISIEISDLPTLSTAITRLEQIPNVVSVRRSG
ncbi:MAG: bifunctional (p)ppGpp synthetase/guanosine-3',5'-bis(diphosphate) 3'-pyrophosphohydrolase [Gammaproteobacteria bacterium]|nr:bifunctional (p)ppGpp synthetase/guanosine-3',5'-bis(diphosphate) 3'-pyrophosphohydrolase [Gammaproteobacteria bacterium]MBT8111089.1 bifunctional (p)ppGpp synthetase/guanosine-3',5'-bis(diphosphate) 3'-pyrophosphohydrolase [Gammaproteobacteria bacterium]NNL45787.1 bifunctional (p)ppGpp synthetase/guanosine-3',5'-bis(diphosphate) 3'-pyrophosphohydrolase [Woeseiaceae bacterium]